MSGYKVPFNGLGRQYASLKEELLHAADLVYSSGRVLDGEYTAKFEQAIATRTDRTYAISVSSCSQALLVSMMAYAGHDTSKKVAVPALSFAATANASVLAGRNIQFIDTDTDGILDISKLDGSHIGIILYVNLFGNVIDYDKLKLVSDFFNDSIPIIEDAAQSFGAYYKGKPSGKLGDISCLSFDPTKNLPNYGSGGMVLTDNDDVAAYVKSFKDNGKQSSHWMVGTNSKMSEADCAQMLVKLKYFDQWQARRAKIAAYYADNLSDIVSVPEYSFDVIPSWHKYVITTVDNRDDLASKLLTYGVETKVHYKTLMPDMPVFRYDGNIPFPAADAISNTALSLPIYPELTDVDVEHVAASIRSVFLNK
jgi:dTDP-4-amino-4,6-dideoxygalactose transaminase